MDSTVSDGGGQFTLSGATMTGGSIVTLYLDGESQYGVTVTLGSGTSMTGVSIYQDRLIVRSDSGSVALTNAMLDIADNNGDSDITAIYTENSGVANVKSGKHLHVWANDTFTPGGNVNVGSGVFIRGTLVAGSNTVTLSGAWVNGGTFTANTSTVALDGTGQSLSGATTFYNLSKSVSSADTLLFRASQTFTISNTTTLQGAASNLLSLLSTTSGTQWSIDPQNGRSISYVYVQDSNNINATVIDPSNSTDGGNTTNWFSGTSSVAGNSGGRHRPNDSPGKDNGKGHGAAPDNAQGSEGTGDEGEGENEPPPPPPAVTQSPDGGVKVTIGLPEALSDLSRAERERLVRARKLERAGEREPGEHEDLTELIGRSEARRLERERTERIRSLRPIVRRVEPIVKPGRITRTVVAQGRMKSSLLSFIERIPLGLQELASQAMTDLVASLHETNAMATILQSASAFAQALMGKSAQAIALLLQKNGFEHDVSEFAKGLLFEHLTAWRLDDKEHGAATTEQPARPAGGRLYSTAMTKIGNTFVIRRLRLSILGPGGIAYASVPVILFSTPQRTFSDQEGIAEFENVEIGEHSLEIHLDDKFVIHKALILDPPEGLDIPEGESIDVIIPLINVHVEEIHGAAPDALGKELLTRIVILITLISMAVVQTCLLIMFLQRKDRFCRFCHVLRRIAGKTSP
jgi:hypothetical protein